MEFSISTFGLALILMTTTTIPIETSYRLSLDI